MEPKVICPVMSYRNGNIIYCETDNCAWFASNKYIRMCGMLPHLTDEV